MMSKRAGSPSIRNYALMFFVVPFIIGGILFSYIGISFLNTRPPGVEGLIDRVLCVFTAFLDMGLAFGIAGLFVYFSGKRIRASRPISNLEERIRLIFSAIRKQKS